MWETQVYNYAIIFGIQNHIRVSGHSIDHASTYFVNVSLSLFHLQNTFPEVMEQALC